MVPCALGTLNHQAHEDRIITPQPLVLQTDELEVVVASHFGPRVTSLRQPGGENVFAELGDLGIDLAGGRKYRLQGGHRLWVAPEIPEITYEPDDEPVQITSSGSDHATVTHPGTTQVPIGKQITVTLSGGTVTVDHRLINRGDEVIDVAPWAITQLNPGGMAILPLPIPPADSHSLQPNASIVLWPYSATEDNPFVLDRRMMMIDARRTTPTKVGTSLDRGWLAYSSGTTLFVKRADQRAGDYLDRGAAAQCYSCADFLELETLGPRVALQPGEATGHMEQWELRTIDPGTPLSEIARRLDRDPEAL